MDLHDGPITENDDGLELPEPPRCGLCELAPPDVYDPVVAAFKKDVDVTLLIENLKLTPDERSWKFLRFMEMVYEVRRAGGKALRSRESGFCVTPRAGCPQALLPKRLSWP